MQSVARHEQQHGGGEFGGYIYALWRELRAVTVDQDLPTKAIKARKHNECPSAAGVAAESQAH
jgi:hypothetical protein